MLARRRASPGDRAQTASTFPGPVPFFSSASARHGSPSEVHAARPLPLRLLRPGDPVGARRDPGADDPAQARASVLLAGLSSCRATSHGGPGEEEGRGVMPRPSPADYRRQSARSSSRFGANLTRRGRCFTAAARAAPFPTFAYRAHSSSVSEANRAPCQGSDAHRKSSSA